MRHLAYNRPRFRSFESSHADHPGGVQLPHPARPGDAAAAPEPDHRRQRRRQVQRLPGLAPAGGQCARRSDPVAGARGRPAIDPVGGTGGHQPGHAQWRPADRRQRAPAVGEPAPGLRRGGFRLLHRPRPAGAKPEQVRSRPGDQARMHLGRPVPAPGQCPRRPSRAVVARTRRRRSLGSGGAAPRHLRQHAGRGGGPATGAGTARPARADPLLALLRPFPQRRRGAGAVSADRHPYTGAGRRRRRPGRGPADHPRDRRCGGAGRGGGRCLSRQPPAH